MKIKLSSNIDANDCTTCANRRPWPETIATIEKQLRAHHVTWPNFVIMHGKDRTCAEALDGAGRKDIGLYVVATDARGVKAKKAHVFRRTDPRYVGVSSILNGSAFVPNRTVAADTEIDNE